MDTKDKIHDKETHGRSDDIDDSTPINKVKGPNVFERAKEEIDAIVEALHPRKDGKEVNSSTHDRSKEDTDSTTHKDKDNFLKNILHKDKMHHNETHGTSSDIDENTPANKVKGPNIFERAKEEIEALVDAIQPKKSDD